MDNSAKPCFLFVKNGDCRFGDRCKFSHDTAVLNRARGNLPSSYSSPQHAQSHDHRLPSSSSQQSTRTQNVSNRARGNQLIPNPSLSSSAAQIQHRTGKKKKTDVRPRNEEATAGRRGLVAAGRVPDESSSQTQECVAQDVDDLLLEAGTHARNDAEEAKRVRQEAMERLRVTNQERERRKKENEARVNVQQEERRKKENEARINAERQRMTDLERRRQEEEERKRREQELRRQEEAHRREEEEARRMQETLVRRARMEAEARETFQKVVDGSLVTFTAGLDIRRIVTGFESCKVVVKGLPLDIRLDEILRLLVQQGLEETQFFVVDIWRQGRKQDFTIIAHNDAAEVLTDRMDDLELRGERVELEFGVFNGVGKMGAQQNDSSNLAVSFWAPSTRCAAFYADAQTAQATMRHLRGHLEGGRQLILVAGRDANSIVINNLPSSIGDDRIRELAGTMQVKRLPTSSFDVDTAIRLLREFIVESAGAVTVDTISKGADKVGLVSLRVRCMSWDDAKNLHGTLERYQPPYICRTKLRLRLPDPLYYTIYISPGQYRAQETIWTSLNDGIKDHSACRLVIKHMDRDYRVQVAGSDKLAVGALKVRVENIAAGTVIPGWHPALGRMQPALVQAIEETQAFVRTDVRKRTVKLYGTPKALEAATTIVREEIERLNGMEITIKVPPSAIRYFRQQGVLELRELLGGENNATFNVAQRALVVKGGEQARRHVYRLIDQARSQATAVTDAQACPICYDTPTSPRMFLCGHIYCTNCLHHFFSSAGDDFPLVCMGNEAKCREPFSIPVMKEFLAPEEFSRLVDGAFSAYIEKRPQEFQPCRTPDCGQIYRRLQQEGELHCPSCFSVVCGACGEDSHVGMNCETAKARGSKDEQERLSELYFQTTGDVKQCPRCSRWMSKISGCNHMECRCGAHVCWRCLSAFDTSGATYAHMRAIHGGFYEPEPAPAPAPIPVQNPQYVPPAPQHDPFLGADYRQQAELLAQAQNIRAVRARLTAVRHLPDPIQYNRVYMPRARTPPPPPPPRQQNQGWCAIM